MVVFLAQLISGEPSFKRLKTRVVVPRDVEETQRRRGRGYRRIPIVTRAPPPPPIVTSPSESRFGDEQIL